MKKIITFLIIVLTALAVNTVAQNKKYRQSDMLAKDIVADAPWRMVKTDSSGDAMPLPIHIFITDSDLPLTNCDLLSINISIKNANQSTFPGPLTFSTYSDSAFLALFTSKSLNDPDMGIQAFDPSMPVKSASKTIKFTQANCSWPYTCTYADITEKFWYFTFNIPSEKLIGMDNIIDIEVTFELNWETDYTTRMRIFRTETPMPALAGWYRGDTHFHSVYTSNEAEFGLPLSASKEAAIKAGLDFITVTDHSCDYDNYGSNMQTNWLKQMNDISQLNNHDSSFIFIRGLEASALNSDGKVVHMLCYPSEDDPYQMNFISDGGGDLFATNKTLGNYLDALALTGGFAFAAHPFAKGDALGAAVNGDIWNLNDSTYYPNTYLIPGAGEVICNDVNLPSDVYAPAADSALLRSQLMGGEIWNAYYNLKTTDDYTDPWNVTHSSSITPFQPIPADDDIHHIFRYRSGLAVADHVNRKGLGMKNQNPLLNNYRFFISAGSDAHGSFNFSNTDYIMGVSGFVDDNAIGKINTLVYCPQGMGNKGQNILKAMRQGQMILSDGPVLYQGIHFGTTSSGNLIPGMDSLMSPDAFHDARLVFNAISDSVFGIFDTITLIVGTQHELYTHHLPIPVSINYQASFRLDSLLNEAMLGDTLNYDEFIFIRSELKTRKNYGVQSDLYCTTIQEFHSFTNPVWISIHQPLVSVNENDDGEFFSLFPNPAGEQINIDFTVKGNFTGIISIFDYTGRLVFTEQLSTASGIHTVDISHMVPGLYYLKAYGKQHCSAKSFIRN